MKLSNWMAAKAVVEVIFGIGFVLMPATLAPLFGMDLNAAGIVMAQLFGVVFIFGSIVLWMARNEPANDTAMRAIILGVVVSNAIGFLVTLFATLGGVWNALGWLPTALFAIFGLAFATFQFGNRTA